MKSAYSLPKLQKIHLNQTKSQFELTNQKSTKSMNFNFFDQPTNRLESRQNNRISSRKIYFKTPELNQNSDSPKSRNIFLLNGRQTLTPTFKNVLPEFLQKNKSNQDSREHLNGFSDLKQEQNLMLKSRFQQTQKNLQRQIDAMQSVKHLRYKSIELSQLTILNQKNNLFKLNIGLNQKIRNISSELNSYSYKKENQQSLYLKNEASIVKTIKRQQSAVKIQKKQKKNNFNNVKAVTKISPKVNNFNLNPKKIICQDNQSLQKKRLIGKNAYQQFQQLPYFGDKDKGHTQQNDAKQKIKKYNTFKIQQIDSLQSANQDSKKKQKGIKQNKQKARSIQPLNKDQIQKFIQKKPRKRLSSKKKGNLVNDTQLKKECFNNTLQLSKESSLSKECTKNTLRKEKKSIITNLVKEQLFNLGLKDQVFKKCQRLEARKIAKNLINQELKNSHKIFQTLRKNQAKQNANQDTDLLSSSKRLSSKLSQSTRPESRKRSSKPNIFQKEFQQLKERIEEAKANIQNRETIIFPKIVNEQKYNMRQQVQNQNQNDKNNINHLKQEQIKQFSQQMINLDIKEQILKSFRSRCQANQRNHRSSRKISSNLNSNKKQQGYAQEIQKQHSASKKKVRKVE